PPTDAPGARLAPALLSLPTPRRDPCEPRFKGSDVELELDHVAVGHDVVLALHAYLAGRAGSRHRAGRHQVVVRDDLGLDEATLEVAVDHPGRLRGGGADRDGPRPRLLRPGGEERLQAQRAETHPDQLVQAGLGLAGEGE